MRNPPQFPVIIGVTGHRRIAPEAVQPVRRAVKDLLASWRCQFGPALHVLTALADGADQLVADVAQECQVPIIAAIPFHHSNYRSILRNQDEFDTHWNNAVFRLELPDIGPDGATDYLDRQYEQLGVLLIRRSHLLLGLWDGELRADRGGTADVIRMRIEGDHDAETFQHSPIFLGAQSYLDETNRGPLLHIFTPRDGETGATEVTMAGCSRLLGLPEPPKRRHWSSLLPVIRWLTQSAEQRKTADERSFIRGVRRLLGLPTLRERSHSDSPDRKIPRLLQLSDGWIVRQGARLVRGLARLFGAQGPTAAVSNASAVGWIGVPVEPKHVLNQILAAGMEDFLLIDKLNRTIGRISGSDELLFRQQLSYLHVTGVPEPALRAAWFLKRLQAGIDTAAQRFQASMLGHFVPANHPWQMLVALYRRQRTTKHTIRFGALAVFALEAPVAVFLFESYVDAQCHSRADGLFYILAYLLVLGGASLYYYLCVLPQAWQERFQDYRALAEALRVQLYWAIAAVPASVSDHYLRKQSGELGWIQFALRGPSLWAASVAGITRKPLRDIIKRGWIYDQESFFASKAELNRRAAEGAELFTTIFVALGVAGSLALSTLYFVQTQSNEPPSCPVEGHSWLIVLTATMPAVAVFFAVSARLRSYWPHAHAYALMRRMFRRAAGLLNVSGASDDQFQNIVRELGREALSENAEWLGEHRNRKIEPGS